MAEVAQAYVSLMFSAKGATDQITKEVAGASAKAGAAGGKEAGKRFHSGMIPGVAKIGAALGGAFAATKVVDFFKDSVGEARESQKVGAITANVIKTTGGAANVTAKSVGNLATAISNKTGIDDEAVQSASNLLLTFTNVRNETGKGNKVFDQATQAATDMAAAMGKEPKSAAIQLGKALNDPVKGITALSKVGVSFTEQQKKQIGTMVKNKDTLGAQKLILGELNKEFGGTAAASSTAGEKMSTAWANTKEQVGTYLLPVIDKVEGVITGKVLPAVSKFMSGMQNGTGPGGRFADVMGRVKDAFAAAAPVIGKVLGFLAQNKAVVATFAGIILTVVAAVKVWTAVQAALDVVLNANPLGLLVIAIAALAAGVVYAYKHSAKFRSILDTVWGVAKKVGSFLGNVFVGYLHILAKTWLTVGIVGVHALRTLLSAAFKVFGGILNAAAKGMGWIPGIGPKIKRARDAFNTFGDNVTSKLRGVEDKLRGVRDGIDGIKSKNVTVGVNVHFQQTGTASAAVAAKHAGATGGYQPRAGGGAVARHRLYLVGENGPELFSPGSNGSIVPNHRLAYSNVTPLAEQQRGNRRVQLVVGDQVFDAYVRDVADNRVKAHRGHAATVGRMG